MATSSQGDSTPKSDWPPGTITLFGYNMHLNLTKLLINLIPFALLAVWQFHFGQLYIWFPASFASQYHPDWTCQTIQVPGGGMCEDVVLWKEFGFALLTCDSNRRKWNTVMGPLQDPNPKGQLVLVDYKQDPVIIETLSLSIPPQMDFHPLGAAFFHQPLHSTLFVANAGRNQSSIELFHISHTSPPKFHWERSISHPLMPNANAILPISSTQLYVTNDHSFRLANSFILHGFETYSASPLTWTTFVDISDNEVIARKVAKFQRVANGITSTPDFSTLFIVESSRGGFGVYSRDSVTNNLKFKEFVSINGHGDNIHFDNQGYISSDEWGQSQLVIGAHPNIIHLTQDVKGIRKAASWILSARPIKDGVKEKEDPRGGKAGKLYRARNYKESWNVRTEVQDDGEWFHSATGAAIDHSRGVMIGTGLYDDHGAFLCRKK